MMEIKMDFYVKNAFLWTSYPMESQRPVLTNIGQGRYTIDLFSIKHNAKFVEYFSIMSSNGLRPIILRPTRVKIHSLTLIYQNCCSSEDVIFKSGVIFSDLTDHFLVFIQMELTDIVVNVNGRLVHHIYRLRKSDHFL